MTWGNVALAEIAEAIVAQHDGHFNFTQREWLLRQGTAVAEEAGEFNGALNRYLGMSRRTGDLPEVAAELADVVVSAYVAAHRLGVDLSQAVRDKYQVMAERGWKDPRGPQDGFAGGS